MSDTFSKWQERTQNLRTHTISVFLGITLATIGFTIDKISEQSFAFVSSCAKTAFFITGALLISHVLTSLILMLNRLEGFRKTTAIVRKKDKGEQVDIKELRQESFEIDQETHWLFNLSVWLFCLAEVSTIVFFVIQISPKLN